MMRKIFAPGTCGGSVSGGLLVFRLWLGLTMLLNHGASKAGNFSGMAQHFADPFHIGSHASLGLVVFAEIIGALLLIFGFATRFGALILVIDMAVAFNVAHHRSLSGAHSGELAFIYLAGFVLLLIAGAGRLSLDQKIFASPRGKGKTAAA